ncbi:MAG: aminotransferase class I/II-fold pyridoxal phosphate-dependent enzyme [Eubacteriales bacterium]|jgi:8-amino-7-oxononanoate synthase
MDLFKKCEEFTSANEARELGIYPYFHALESRQDIEVMMEGKRRIMLGSNNYLGLTVHPEVTEAAIKAVEQYGSGCSGSRFLNGTLMLHLELEQELAEFLGKESVMTFSTGYQSNLGIISAIASRHDYILCDRENHASIYDGCRLSYAKMLRYRHNDMEDLERLLKTVPDNAGKLIVTDGVFSMGGDICNLPEIVRLAKKYGARVMVDDAHGLGVLGNGGRGTADYFGLTDEVDIIMGTFSKSLASLGGYMAADSYVVDFVRHTSRPFIFCASIPPSNCASALAALRVLKREPELPKRLIELSNYVRNGLKARGISIRESNYGITPIIPLYTYTPIATLTKSKMLFEAGVYVNPVLPPATPPNECLLRTSYMASHTESLLDEAMDIIKETFEKHDKMTSADEYPSSEDENVVQSE